MESKICEYVINHFGDVPAFIYGSVADGIPTKNSDIDVGILSDKRPLQIGNIDFRTMDVSNLEHRISRNIHERDINAFSKAIVPINKENILRSIEEEIKLNIANYVLKKLNVEKSSISGKEILATYLEEQTMIFPYSKPSLSRFLSSKAIDVASEDYERILESCSLPFDANYRVLGKPDILPILISRIINAYLENPGRAFTITKEKLPKMLKHHR